MGDLFSSGFLSNIQFKKMDVEHLEYQESSFDIITCGYGLFFYPEMEKTFCNICKCLKKGGCFVFSTFVEQAFTPYAGHFLNLLEHSYGIECPKVSRSRLQNEQQIRDLCRHIQARQVSVTHQKIRYPISVNDWWALLNNAAYKALLDQLTPENLNKFRTEHLSELETMSHQGTILLNADSLYAAVEIS